MRTEVARARMTILLTAASLLFLASFVLAQDEDSTIRVRVVDVYDGDSITVDALRALVVVRRGGISFVTLQEQAKVRVCCLDTPERNWRGKCEAERELAEEARTFVRQALLGNIVTLHVQGLEKFGRILARLTMPNGQMLDDAMVEKGLARYYHGEARTSWCE